MTLITGLIRNLVSFLLTFIYKKIGWGARRHLSLDDICELLVITKLGSRLHAEFSMEIEDLLKKILETKSPLSLLQYDELSKFLKKLGHFILASQVVSEKKKYLKKNSMKSPVYALKLIYMEIADGNITNAVILLDGAIKSSLLFRIFHQKEIREIKLYLDICQSNDLKIKFHRFKKPSESIFSNKKVLFIGPSPYNTKVINYALFDIVVRIFAPGVTWLGPRFEKIERTDVVYLNGESNRWYQQLSDSKQFESQFFEVILKENLDFPNNFKKIGNLNMAQLVILNILSKSPESLTVAGINFFAAKVNYRSDSRRIHLNGNKINEVGSTGERGRMCSMLASHDPSLNRNLIKNLKEVKTLHFEQEVLEVLNLSDYAYLKKLQENIGYNML